MTFKLTAFPASDGDCLLLSYGVSPAKHVLIDGGRTSTYSFLRPALRRIVEANKRIELLVLTHIDADHIEGFLPLVTDEELGLKIDEMPLAKAPNLVVDGVEHPERMPSPVAVRILFRSDLLTSIAHQQGSISL